jgi:thioredoxin-related protein
MKKIIATVLLSTTAFIMVCIAQQPKGMYTHNFPAEMDASVKDQYVKLFEKGRILYQMNCARCHNTKVKGIETMPEFTKEHLAKYELRLQNPQHESDLNEEKVTAEELQQIMIFLMYSKKVEKK